MSHSPHISIIVPCYNYGHYLSMTLESVFEQSFKGWECIIIDDGSTDNSAEVAKTWVNKDPRFIYIRQDNAGLSAARNTGIKHAAGRYIQFLDADDLLLPEKLSIQVQLLEQNAGVAAIYSSFSFQDEHNQRYGPEPHHYVAPKKQMLRALIFEWEYGFIMPIHCFLFEKEALINTAGFYEEIPTHEDLDLHLRLALRDEKYFHHPEKLAIYRVHSTSMSRNYTRMQLGYLMALGRAFTTASDFFIKSLLFIRFGMELAQCFIHFFRGRKINLLQIITGIPQTFLSILGLLLLPIFIFIKLLRRFA